MKKHNKTKKLALSAQTVRTLADQDLAGAGGAGNTFVTCKMIRSCGLVCWE